MKREVVTTKKAILLKDDGEIPVEDLVVMETPITIYLNGKELTTLLCTPEKLDYLTLGFLSSEGLIQSYEQVKELRVREDKGSVEVELDGGSGPAENNYGKNPLPSGRGKTLFENTLDGCCPVTSRVKFDRHQIRAWMDLVQKHSVLFRATGGVHGAALADHHRLLFFSEDIGRHNAVDKIIGECLSKDIALKEKALISTGRLSSEILLKAARLFLPVLVSRSAPTSLAVELAEQLNITVIGFARGLRMSVYTHPWRII